MNRSTLNNINKNFGDLVFIGILALCMGLGITAVGRNIEKQEIRSSRVGARKIDVGKVRKQISEGRLSPHKALFFKKIQP